MIYISESRYSFVVYHVLFMYILPLLLLNIISRAKLTSDSCLKFSWLALVDTSFVSDIIFSIRYVLNATRSFVIGRRFGALCFLVDKFPKAGVVIFPPHSESYSSKNMSTSLFLSISASLRDCPLRINAAFFRA